MGDSDSFRNIELPLIERVEDLIGRLTLEEKAGLVSSSQIGIERLGISEWHIGWEVARGYVGRVPEEPSTVLPQPIGMAAMFDPELMYQLGELAGNETRVYYQKDKRGKLMLFGPTVDMERDPRWGRTEEAYGEDPYLTGQMTIAYTKGLKGEDPFYIRTVPGLKHFCANNNEKNRGSCSANLEPRTKHEYYYKAFRASIVEGGAISVMAAYNELSGVPALLHPDLKSVLKDQWGLQFIMSDGADFVGNVIEHHYVENHVESIALALKAGADIMLDDADVVRWSVLEAVNLGLLSEEELEKSIKRTLAVRFRLGEFDPADKNPYANLPASLINCDNYKKLNQRAAKEQVILLKNQGLLPLEDQKDKKIAVLGPLADKNYMDWYTGFSDYNISVLEGIKRLVGADKILYDNAYDKIALKSEANLKYLSVRENEEIIAEASTIGVAETFEHHDWDFGSHNFLSLKNNKFMKEEQDVKAAGINTYEWFVREWLKIKEYSDSLTGSGTNLLLDTWNDHHIEIDKNNKLTTSEITKVSKERLFTKEMISAGIERAVKLALEADIAIVCVGNDPLQVARECYDRPDLVLPKHQSELIKAVYQANPNTIVVIVSSYPYAINWEAANIPAILFSSHAGPELGTAIAEVLFGKYNPAGRTPMTWYKSVYDLPDIMDYDIIKNDMTYQYFQGNPLYPFGYGLSYSTFEYQDMQIEDLLSSSNGKANTLRLRIQVTVCNTSSRDGEEVVQLYYRMNNSRVKRPLRQLCGFRRVSIKAGEKVVVEFLVKSNDLEFYDVTRERFCVEQGEYTFLVGSSCKNICKQENITLEGDIIPPQTLRQFTPAINYDDKYGVEMNFSKEKGMHYIAAKGDCRHMIKFGTVDLTGAGTIEFNAATGIGRSYVDIHVDTADGEPIRKVEIPVTGGPTYFTNVMGKLTGVEGIHDLYFIFGQGVSLLDIRIN